jgi:hypothetical protein
MLSSIRTVVSCPANCGPNQATKIGRASTMSVTISGVTTATVYFDPRRNSVVIADRRFSASSCAVSGITAPVMRLLNCPSRLGNLAAPS